MFSSSKKSAQTTKMIILMTVASIISEAPLGISSILQVFSGRSLGLLYVQQLFFFNYWSSNFRMLSADLIENLGMFVAMNSLTHCFISFVIYTQYRNTVKNSFRCKIKTIKPNKVCVLFSFTICNISTFQITTVPTKTIAHITNWIFNWKL